MSSYPSHGCRVFDVVVAVAVMVDSMHTPHSTGQSSTNSGPSSGSVHRFGSTETHMRLSTCGLHLVMVVEVNVVVVLVVAV